MNITLIGTGSYGSPLSIRPRALAMHLAAQGHQVSLIVPRADKYNGFTPTTVQNSAMQVIQPWQVVSRSMILNLLPYLFTMPIALLKTRPAVVVICKATPITIGGLVARLFGRTVITDSDDLGSEVMRAEGQSALLVALVAGSEKLARRWSNGHVVVSRLLAANLSQHNANKPVAIIPNGVEPADYAVPATKTLRPSVYYFGVINRLEIVEPLLRAIPAVRQKTPNASFTIIGGGAALDEAKQLAKDLSITDIVSFPGWQSDMLAVQKYVHFGDVAICYQPDTAPVQAASNMKVFQYMAMGSVPVVSEVGDLPSYVQNGAAGVVVPANNTSKLADAIISLLADNQQRVALATNCKRLAREQYSWQRHAATLSDFIASIMPRAQTKEVTS